MFETCIDVSNVADMNSKYLLPHLFDDIIETFSPDYFIVSSKSVFELFFFSSRTRGADDDGEESNCPADLRFDHDSLQHQVEKFCRSGKLILKISEDALPVDDVDDGSDKAELFVKEILDRCTFLDVPRILISANISTQFLQALLRMITRKKDSEEAEEEEKNIVPPSDFTTSISFEIPRDSIEDFDNFFQLYLSIQDLEVRMEKFSLWLGSEFFSSLSLPHCLAEMEAEGDDEEESTKNHIKNRFCKRRQEVLPILLSEHCVGLSLRFVPESELSITQNNISLQEFPLPKNDVLDHHRHLDLALLSAFAARSCVFCLDLSPVEENEAAGNSRTSATTLNFDLVHSSVSFLSLLIKTIIEQVGTTIQRKSFLQNQPQNQQQSQQDENDKSVGRELSLASANDKLQFPLQPLREILPFTTYSEFERDSPKYQKYEEAIRLELAQLINRNNSNSKKNKNNNSDSTNLLIVVLGAGSRGPLLSRLFHVLINNFLLPLEETKQDQTNDEGDRSDDRESTVRHNNNNNGNYNSKIQIVAVEKNKLAFDMLRLKKTQDPLWKQFSSLSSPTKFSRRRLRHDDRDEDVRVDVSFDLIPGDGRSKEHVGKKIVEKLLLDTGTSCCFCDDSEGRKSDHSSSSSSSSSWNLLLVSELLGSFGDNELSPECIEGFLVALQQSLDDANQEQRKHQLAKTNNNNNNNNNNSFVSIKRVVSIPAKYTSYVALCRAPRLQREIEKAVCCAARASADVGKREKRNAKKHFQEQPYVVKATNVWFESWKYYTISQNNNNNNLKCGEFLAPIFTFDHTYFTRKRQNSTEIVEDQKEDEEEDFCYDCYEDLKTITDRFRWCSTSCPSTEEAEDEDEDEESKKKKTSSSSHVLLAMRTTKETTVSFRLMNCADSSCRQHLQPTGLLGFFSADLDRDGIAKISTVPTTEHHTPDLYSWFPIYFPLQSLSSSPSSFRSPSPNSEFSDEVEVIFRRQYRKIETTEQEAEKMEGMFYSWGLRRKADEIVEMFNEAGESYLMEL